MKLGFILALACLLILLSLPLVMADGGYVSPDPRISVQEPGQKAIIGWDGENEVLILSTDVAASENTWVVELIPFPSQPTIKAENYDSFLKIQEIINNYIAREGDVNGDGDIDILDALQVARYDVGLNPIPFNPEVADVDRDGRVTILDALLIAQYDTGLIIPIGLEGVEILFENEIGVHDLTILRPDNASALIDYAKNLLSQKVSTENVSWENLESLASDYLARGMNYWALDLLNLENREKTREPILYTFTSDHLYYPLKISSLGLGITKITIFTLTGNELDGSSIESAGLQFKHFGRYFDVSNSEMSQISSEISNLLKNNAKLAHLEYQGQLKDLSGDLIVGSA